MNINNINDEQIIEFISQNLEKKRLSKKISSEELAKKGGHISQTYSNFINKNTNIRILTLIQVLRGLGELDKLQSLIEFKEPFSPLGNSSELPKRVRTSIKKTTSRPKWGDEK